MYINCYIINVPVKLGLGVVINKLQVMNNATRKTHTRNMYSEITYNKEISHECK
jgi:hypothetical protein